MLRNLAKTLPINLTIAVRHAWYGLDYVEYVLHVEGNNEFLTRLCNPLLERVGINTKVGRICVLFTWEIQKFKNL